MIKVSVKQEGVRIADIVYQAGLLVEVNVADDFEGQSVSFPLAHSPNNELKGDWGGALDRYFNEGLFDSRDNLFPGEMKRSGAARDHRNLFRQAAFALSKDLEPYGYQIEIEFA
jgi:hypothetical protein